jgi:hypothetical protein
MSTQGPVKEAGGSVRARDVALASCPGLYGREPVKGVLASDLREREA